MRSFVVMAEENDIDAVSDVLWQLGVRAIEERRTETTVELWTAVGDDDAAIVRAGEALRGRWPHRIVEVADTAADTWREFAEPVFIADDLVIVPEWKDAGPNSSSATVVRIEPGGAFGLGDHPTTMLSLRAMTHLLDGETDVIDVGCGTGVIAVTAALLQGRPVRAIDVASAAVEATTDNAQRNGVADRVVVDTTALADVDETYDLVVANILAPVLISLADDLRRVTRPGGRLVISGILAASKGHVLAALEPLLVERTDELDGWAAVVLRHRDL